jgi:hypothetical protein
MSVETECTNNWYFSNKYLIPHKMCEDYHVQVMHFMSTLDLVVLHNE